VVRIVPSRGTHAECICCFKFTAIEGVAPLLKSIQPPPGILVSQHVSVPAPSPLLTFPTEPQFCASMWTPEQQTQIQQIARDTIPGIRTAAIPTGLQVEKGPDAVVEYLKGKIDEIMA
jgi:hypothetical protein